MIGFALLAVFVKDVCSSAALISVSGVAQRAPLVQQVPALIERHLQRLEPAALVAGRAAGGLPVPPLWSPHELAVLCFREPFFSWEMP